MIPSGGRQAPPASRALFYRQSLRLCYGRKLSADQRAAPAAGLLAVAARGAQPAAATGPARPGFLRSSAGRRRLQTSVRLSGDAPPPTLTTTARPAGSRPASAAVA